METWTPPQPEQPEVDETLPPVEPSGVSLTRKRKDQARGLASAKATWTAILVLLPPPHFEDYQDD